MSGQTRPGESLVSLKQHSIYTSKFQLWNGLLHIKQDEILTSVLGSIGFFILTFHVRLLVALRRSQLFPIQWCTIPSCNNDRCTKFVFPGRQCFDFNELLTYYCYHDHYQERPSLSSSLLYYSITIISYHFYRLFKHPTTRPVCSLCNSHWSSDPPVDIIIQGKNCILKQTEDPLGGRLEHSNKKRQIKKAPCIAVGRRIDFERIILDWSGCCPRR